MKDAQERAKELYEAQYGKIAPELLGVNEALTRTLGLYTNALAQVEAETWEQAAIRLEQDCWCENGALTETELLHNRNQLVLACQFRQRAQRAKEGT